MLWSRLKSVSAKAKKCKGQFKKVLGSRLKTAFAKAKKC